MPPRTLRRTLLSPKPRSPCAGLSALARDPYNVTTPAGGDHAGERPRGSLMRAFGPGLHAPREITHQNTHSIGIQSNLFLNQTKFVSMDK